MLKTESSRGRDSSAPRIEKSDVDAVRQFLTGSGDTSPTHGPTPRKHIGRGPAPTVSMGISRARNRHLLKSQG